MTRQLPRLVLALSLAAISADLVLAKAAPAKNPCPNASELTRRADILEAVPAGDPDWQEALVQRGIHKTEAGEWMQYFTGGEATAGNSAFVAALENYCAARARAAVAAKSNAAAKIALPPLPPAALANEEAARMTRAKARVLMTSAPSDEALPAAPEAPAAVSDSCPSLCEVANTCRDAGMGGQDGGIDFPCRKALRETSAAKCKCS
jgi:hypothetical protein